MLLLMLYCSGSVIYVGVDVDVDVALALALSYHVDVVILLEGCADSFFNDLQEFVVRYVGSILKLIVYFPSKNLFSKYFSSAVPVEKSATVALYSYKDRRREKEGKGQGERDGEGRETYFRMISVVDGSKRKAWCMYEMACANSNSCGVDRGVTSKQ